MNLFDRFILTIYSFALIVLSAGGIVLATQLLPQEYIEAIIADIYAGQHIPYLIVSAIFLIISLRFFFSAFTARRPKVEKGIRQRNDLGDVNITLTTIQAIAEKAARKVKGVRDLKTTIKVLESGNVILFRIAVDGETPLPELTQKLQQDVKTLVETIAGVSIAEIAVVVTDVVSVEHASVRSRRVE